MRLEEGHFRILVTWFISVTCLFTCILCSLSLECIVLVAYRWLYSLGFPFLVNVEYYTFIIEGVSKGGFRNLAL